MAIQDLADTDSVTAAAEGPFEKAGHPPEMDELVNDGLYLASLQDALLLPIERMAACLFNDHGAQSVSLRMLPPRAAQDSTLHVLHGWTAPFEGADLFRKRAATPVITNGTASRHDACELDVRVFPHTGLVVAKPRPGNLQGLLASSTAAAFYRTLLAMRLAFLSRTQVPDGVEMHFEFTPQRRVLTAYGPLMNGRQPARQVQSPWLTESLIEDRHPFVE